MQNASNMMNKKKRARAPSIYTQFKDDLDCSRLDAHSKSFTRFMTKAYNEERHGDAFKVDGNIVKILSYARNILTFASTRLEWGGTPSYEWLLESECFAELYHGYKDELIKRGNDRAYIGKQLDDLTHVIHWAGLQVWETQKPGWERVDLENNPELWEWVEEQAWEMDRGELDGLIFRVKNLAAQLRSRGTKQKNAAKELVQGLDPNEPELDIISIRKQVDEMELELTTRLRDTTVIADADKLAVAELLILKMLLPGARPLTLHHVTIASNESSWDDIAESTTDGCAVLIKGETDKLFVYVKNHFMSYSLTDVADLLALFWKAFPELGDGDIMFTPEMHGTRLTKATDPSKFHNSSQLGDYFEIIFRDCFGHKMRPKGLRRLNATYMSRLGSSQEVKESHAALIGTSARRLDDTYNQRSIFETSHLASEVQRHQSNPLFDEAEHNLIAPVMMQSGCEFSVVRIVRKGGSSSPDLCAVFHNQDTEHVELSTQFIEVAPELRDVLPKAHLMMDDSNLQVWRNAHDAKSRFDNAWIREFVTNSIVINKPRPMAKDMVYIMHECALAEVKCTHTDGEQQGMLEVAMATEHRIPGRSTTKTFFRFEQDAKRSLVSESDVCFPVDVTFNKKDGFFQVLKSITMRTV